MMEEISGSLKGRFVDDDDIVRTGRAMIEIDGWDFLHVPIPTGLSGKLKSFESSMDSRLVKSREDAASAASSAGNAARAAGEARESASAAEGAAGRAAASESSAAGSESAARGHAGTAGEQASAARGQAEAAASSAEEAKDHASAAEGHASRARSSAEGAGRAADRAEGARGELGTARDAAVQARDAARGHASTAEGHANAASASAREAEGAVGRADAAARQVREIATSTRWDGDRVTVNGKQSPRLTGPRGERGPQGPPGEVDNIDLSQYARLDQLTDVVRSGDLNERLASYKPKTTRYIGDKSQAGVPIAAGRDGIVVISGSVIMSSDAKLSLNNPGNIQALNPPKKGKDVTNKEYVDEKVANVTVDTSGLATKQELNSVRDRVGALESKGSFWTGSKQAYDRIGSKDPNTLYIVR
ncbi:hypothetical protein GWO56_06790 [Corynebacterium macginleyi]|uniref:phage upper tail fiber protein n=1 Tax=Corynebacterium macginleyi TaxID=38290 RepID=UPI00190B0A5D|nr:hypothetical protein [Corynebacterium macginleyi]MBK4159244.1 hypothetical protein [Corynebacterium macginleyi]